MAFTLRKLELEVLRQIASAGTQHGHNVIAFSGGVDSSLCAALVHRVFPHNTIAVTGVSASLPKAQLKQAKEISSQLGVQFRTVQTNEGQIPEYKANQGKSCYYCKTSLYSMLSDSSLFYSNVTELLRGDKFEIRIFNGTNKDDLVDSTRVGLKAAQEYKVQSPLQILTKQQVRQLANKYKLANHDVAASPCLRSRLAKGVEASVEHMQFVEHAEAIVKEVLELQPHENIRVRLLPRSSLRLEVDEDRLEIANQKLQYIISQWRVPEKLVQVAKFRSGSVAA